MVGINCGSFCRCIGRLSFLKRTNYNEMTDICELCSAHVSRHETFWRAGNVGRNSVCSSASCGSLSLPWYKLLHEPDSWTSRHQPTFEVEDITAVSDIGPQLCGNTGKRKWHALLLIGRCEWLNLLGTNPSCRNTPRVIPAARLLLNTTSNNRDGEEGKRGEEGRLSGMPNAGCQGQRSRQGQTKKKKQGTGG